MPVKDKKLVNFSEDYELNNRLRRNGKRQTEDNRQELKKVGVRAKKQLDKSRLTHSELDQAIENNSNKFE